MGNNIEIKLATIDDLAAIEKVGDKLFDNKIKTNRAIEFLNDPRHHLVLAYHKDQVVGMASGFHHVHPDKDPALFIDEAGVLDEYQNQGIGQGLIKFICEHGKSLGCHVAWVTTAVSNTAARKAYSKAGGKEDKDSFVLIEFKM